MEMKGFVHIRIDDRLIHGQVANFWTNELNVNRIMVINDYIANDSTQKSILKMAAPSNVSTSIITKEKAISNISQNKYASQKVLLVVKSPVEIVELLKAGFDIKEVNVGNLSSRPDTELLKNNISVTLEEKKALEEMLNHNVKVTCMMTPSDSYEELSKYM